MCVKFKKLNISEQADNMYYPGLWGLNIKEPFHSKYVQSLLGKRWW